MDLERWRRLEDLFEAAISIPPAERKAFLDTASADDPQLKRQVESLILADEDAGAFIEEAIEEAIAVAVSSSEIASTPPVPSRVGPYRLIRELGRGGMGSVHLAVRDDDQYRKEVAVKIVRSGRDTPELVRRFLDERQILANLEHPNIARLLDGGATADRLPYVVMEHVVGEPIVAYCSKRALSLKGRLEIFRRVCAAVQHAHKNLIVHRDLKPSNILVGSDGEPKLLDFGIAKLLDSPADPKLETLPETRLLTPEYASPEQVRGEPVTTASDIYSLGVLLYELLSRKRPYRLGSRELEELRRVICDQDPEPPSAAVVSGQGVPSQDAERLRKQLRGDLDAIVLKAMEKEPANRYDSAAQLSEDVRRFVEGLPVLARPDEWSYRTKKFTLRHKWAVTAAALALTIIVGFSVAMTVQSARLADERDRVAREQVKSERVLGFMTELFEITDPSEARGNQITAREILDKGAQDIATGLEGQDEVKATLLETMGGVYRSLGLYEQSRPLLEDALDIRERVLGEEHRDVAKSKHQLGALLISAGEYEEAGRQFEEALVVQEKIPGGPDPELAKTLSSLGVVRSRVGRHQEAQELHARALEIVEAVHGNEHRQVAITLSNLATSFRAAGEPDRAKPALERVLAIMERISGPEHPDTAIALSNLATALHSAGDYQGARPYFERAVSIHEKVLGADHPILATTLRNLGTSMRRSGEFAGARSLYQRALLIGEKALGPDHPEVGVTLQDLGVVEFAQGRPEEAIAYLERALEILEKSLGQEHFVVAINLHTTGVAFLDLGEFTKAHRVFTRALDVAEARRPDGVQVAFILQSMAMSLLHSGAPDKAEAALRRASDILEREQGLEHPHTAQVLVELATLYVRQGRVVEGESLFREVEPLLAREPGSADRDLNFAAGRFWAISGHTERALQQMTGAAELGYSRNWIAVDPDLFHLRGDPEFDRLLREHEKRLGE